MNHLKQMVWSTSSKDVEQCGTIRVLSNCSTPMRTHRRKQTSGTQDRWCSMDEQEWNDLTKDQQGDWIEYWSNLEEGEEDE